MTATTKNLEKTSPVAVEVSSDFATQSPGFDRAATPSPCEATFVELRQEVINWLIENNFPVLPAAPKQDSVKYPKKNSKHEIEYEGDGVTPKSLFTGKNPSYLDESGIPHLVFHTKYQNTLPTESEIKKWFANPLNGIGTLGGWNNAVWIDFDVKHFDSTSECEDAALDCAEVIEEQFGAPFIEKTHSGGWRIGVCVEETPSFTNFCIKKNGKQVGEALFKGRFTVLAPTIGISGNSYENINRVKLPVVPSLEAIGIYPTNSRKQNNSIPRRVEVNYNQIEKPTGSIFLDEICSSKSKEVLAGNNIHDDRSESLTMAIKEWYGWINWCADNNVPIYGSVENLTFQAGRNLGIDDDRISRILKTVDNPGACECASFYNGKDKSCWKKVRHYNREVFDMLCPTEIKEIVNKEVVEFAQSRNVNSLKNGKNKLSQNKSSEQITKEIKKSFCQHIYDNLFFDNSYIYVFHQFHEWTGTHYEPIANEVITKKIHDYCDKYPVVKEKEIIYPYAAPSFVMMALSWLKQKFGIDPKLVNPPGLNCIDGILQLSFDPDSQKLIKTLVPHNPSFYYLYAPQATYHISPITLPTACESLLSCLEPQQRDIFLKTIGAAFDLQTVRRYRGREVRGLLLHGYGNNGKDTLRNVTSMMFGYRGMVSASLSDFKQYDEGRKFPLQKLDGALVNWPSENADCMMLDRIQSLKIAITGDPLSGEKKGKDEYLFNPKAVQLFNINSPPRLQGAMEAISSRFSFIKFSKTFKTNPKPGELQADPRFLYDPDFVRTDVLPWYLYYCLDALDRLMKEGINYDVTEGAWEDLRAESDHVYAFCKEVGIGYKHNGQLGADEVYTVLRDWYIQNGSLEIQEFSDGRTKDNWSPDPAWGDHLIKAKNLVFSRLLKIFPEARRQRDGNGRSVLVGIGWNSPTPPDGDTVSLCYTSEAVLKQSEDDLKRLQPLPYQYSEAAEGVFPISGEKEKEKTNTSCCCGHCPSCFSESAKNLGNAMLRCESGTEVRELLAQYPNLSEAAWRSLTNDGQDHIRNLMLMRENKEHEFQLERVEESYPQNHLQSLQNTDTVRIEASSGHLQTASEQLQNCSHSIQNEPIDFSDYIARTNIELARLGWTTEQGKAHLLKTYGKRSRQLLSDPELVDFLAYLESQPTPQPENSSGIEEKAQLEQVDVIAADPVEETRMVLPQETDEIQTAAELEYSPVQYNIHLSKNDSEWGCTFIQRIGNICQFACREDELIDIEVDGDSKFLGGVIVKKWNNLN